MTFAESVGRFEAPMLRRLLIALGVLLVYWIARQIPLPGLDLDALQGSGLAHQLPSDRLSIFAIGVTPIFSVLVLVEFVKMAFPGLRRWEMANAANATRLARIVTVLALLMAGFQALGLAGAFEGIKGLVPEPGWEFRIGIVATLVAATALLAWLCEFLTQKGLGAGFWLLLIAPVVMNLPSMIIALWELLRLGAISTSATIFALGFVVLSLAAMAYAVTLQAPDARSRAFYAPDFGTVWPPILANVLTSLILVPIVLFSGNKGLPPDSGFAYGGAMHLLMIAALIALFSFLRGPLTGRSGSPSWCVTWIAAVMQILICCGGEWLVRIQRLPFAIDGSMLIVTAVVAMSWLMAFGVAMPKRGVL